METARSSGGRSGNSSTYSPETAESFRFEEEIQSLMLHPTFDPPLVGGGGGGGGGGNSFTALLGLPPIQAVKLLHDPPPPPPVISVGYRLRGDSHHDSLPLPLGCSPTFPSNAALIDRAARFSVFAAEESPEASNSGDVKPEPADSGDVPPPTEKNQKVTGSKRKEAEKSKVKGTAKKSKSVEENTAGGGEKLPYVHVRARRGQATDSHSLAERARREKINARMKLLQELVPGCNKISGTALVLDEIINHVQSLQRQVEFLSMRLAAINPRIDFNGLDNILSSECGPLTAAGAVVAMPQPSAWLDGVINKQQHLWLVDPQQQQQQQLWERDGIQDSHIFVSNPTASSIFAYDSSNPDSVTLANQLKTELVSLPNQLKTEL